MVSAPSLTRNSNHSCITITYKVSSFVPRIRFPRFLLLAGSFAAVVKPCHRVTLTLIIGGTGYNIRTNDIVPTTDDAVPSPSVRL